MFHFLRWLVSSGEDVPYNSGIQIFLHNRSRLVKSVLAGPTRNPDCILRLQRHEYSGFHPGIWLNGISGRSVPLSRLCRPKAMNPLKKIGCRKPGSLPDLTQSSPHVSHLDVTQTSKIMRSHSHDTPEVTSDPKSLLFWSFSSLSDGSI